MSKHEAHIKQHLGDSHSIEQGYEVSDVSAKGLLITGVVMVIATAISFVFSIVVANMFMHGERGRLSDTEISPLIAETDTRNNEWVTGTRLQVDLGAELGAEKAKALHGLTTYGTVSDAPEIYHIPIDVAIDLVVENGLPKFPIVEAKVD